MHWLQLEMALDKPDAERFEQALIAAGALSVTFSDAADEPILEPEPGTCILWPATHLAALFPADADLDAIRIRMLAALPLEHLPPHRFTSLADRNWEREWLKDFKPMRFGRRLWIVPSAYTPPDPAAVNIGLDPGLAFGTGTHATTALCLEWLDAAELTGKEVIDYGCGSGILAIAAARLGARQVTAVDHDPQALNATHSNALANGVAERITTCPPDALPPRRADVLLANILARPLMQLAPRFAVLLKPGATLLLSGILDTQEDALRAAYAPRFRFISIIRRGEWLGFEARLREYV